MSAKVKGGDVKAVVSVLLVAGGSDGKEQKNEATRQGE